MYHLAPFLIHSKGRVQKANEDLNARGASLCEDGIDAIEILGYIIVITLKYDMFNGSLWRTNPKTFCVVYGCLNRIFHRYSQLIARRLLC